MCNTDRELLRVKRSFRHWLWLLRWPAQPSSHGRYGSGSAEDIAATLDGADGRPRFGEAAERPGLPSSAD